MYNQSLKYTVLLLLMSFSASSYSQSFYKELITEAEYIHDSAFKVINVDSLNNAFWRTQNVNMIIDANATYQLLFVDGIDWEHHVGNAGPWTFKQQEAQSVIMPLLDTTIVQMPNRKKYYEAAAFYTGKELIQETGLGYKQRIANQTTFTSFPEIYERTDKYNGQWMLFSNGEILIFRYVHSYPHGNATSWYKEKRIYLKRIK